MESWEYWRKQAQDESLPIAERLLAWEQAYNHLQNALAAVKHAAAVAEVTFLPAGSLPGATCPRCGGTKPTCCGCPPDPIPLRETQRTPSNVPAATAPFLVGTPG